MSKGSNIRPHNKIKYDSEYDRIFGKKTYVLRDLAVSYLKVLLQLQCAKDYDDSVALSQDLTKATQALNSLDKLEVARMATKLAMPVLKDVTEVTKPMIDLAEDAVDIAIKFSDRKDRVYAEFETLQEYL